MPPDIGPSPVSTARLATIGIGRSLAAPPSHTTRHTGPYQGGSIWLHALRCLQADEAPLIKEAVVQCYPYPWGMADSPWPFAPPRGHVRQAWVDPPLDQFRLPSPVHLPVFPLEASETMAYPAVRIPHHRGRLAAATVALPSLPILMQRRDDGLQATPLGPFRQRFDPRFAPVEGLWGHFPSPRRLPPRTTAP
jgi:hypothetical protein